MTHGCTRHRREEKEGIDLDDETVISGLTST